MSNQHWTWAQVEAMTLDQVLPLLEYWRKHPPLRDLVELVARCMGYKPPSDEPVDVPRAPTAQEIKMLYPDGFIRG